MYTFKAVVRYVLSTFGPRLFIQPGMIYEPVQFTQGRAELDARVASGSVTCAFFVSRFADGHTCVVVSAN